jgi:hypothetical protein
VSVTAPAFAIIPPQIHQEITITITALSQNTPVKAPFHHAKKNTSKSASQSIIPSSD